jgi:hypothetical protein
LIIDNDRTFPSDSPVCAYWLTRCEGFTVRRGRHVLGVVESIAGGPRGLAETLHVHSRFRQRLLDAGQVTAVVPGRQLLIAEPAPVRVRPVLSSAARAMANALVLVSALLVRVVAFLVPRIATGVRVCAVTAGRLTRDEVLPRVRTTLTVLIDEVERLTLLDGEAQPVERATHSPARQRRNRARELRQQAREEEEHRRVAEIAEQALP